MHCCQSNTLVGFGFIFTSVGANYNTYMIYVHFKHVYTRLTGNIDEE